MPNIYNPQSGGAPMSFAELQRRGYARPGPDGFGAMGAQPGMRQPGQPGQAQPQAQPPAQPQQQPQFTPAAAPPPPAARSNPVRDKLYGNFMNFSGLGPFAGAQPTRIGQAREQGIFDAMQNPSRYDSNVAQSTLQRFKSGLDEDFDVKRQLIGEEMSRRGLDASTIHGGRLGDLTIQHDRNLSNLMADILREQANTYASDRASAYGMAGDYEDDQYGRAADTYRTNAATQGQNYGQQMGWLQQLMGYDQQGYENQITTEEFNRQLDNDEFDQWLQMYLASGGGS